MYDEILSQISDLNPVSGFKSKSFDLSKISCRTDIERMMGYDLMTYLPDDILTKVDRASMFTSLEARVPLLDYRIVEFAWQLPTDFKFNNESEKWILKKLLNQYFPSELMNRPKSGFSVPLASWLRGPLKAWAKDLLSEDELKKHNLLNSKLIKDNLKLHLENKSDLQSYLWNVLIFQSWYNKWN